MINFVVPKDRKDFIVTFTRRWARSLKSQFRLITYDHLEKYKSSLPQGTYILTDTSSVSESQAKLIKELASAGKEAGFKILNASCAGKSRKILFQQIRELGINPLRVYSLKEEPEAYPVFLREEADRIGAVSGPLYSLDDMQREIEKLRENERRYPLLLAEYISCGIDGEYTRIHSAIRIGDKIVERGRYKGERKIEISEDGSFVERDLLQFHELAPKLMQVFELANVEYGRIDFAVVDGKIAVWEIMDNPSLLPSPQFLGPLMKERAWEVADSLCVAFDELDDPRGGNLMVPPRDSYRMLAGASRVTVS